MKVKELKEKLEDFNDDLEIIFNEGDLILVSMGKKELSVEEISGDETEQEFLCFGFVVV